MSCVPSIMLHVLVMVVALILLDYSTAASNLCDDYFGETMTRVLKHCSHSCKGGSCRYENCKNSVDCPGGLCYFKSCSAPACRGGGCTFYNSTQATCNGGKCLFLSPRDTLADGYCEGRGCFLERAPHPLVENYVSL